VSCWAAVRLRAEQRHVVLGQLGLCQQGGFVLGQALPSGLVFEVACFNVLNEAKEVDRRSVFVLDLVQQVHGRVVGEEPVLAVVENEVLRSGREGHKEHEHHQEGGLGPRGRGVGQAVEQPGHVRLWENWDYNPVFFNTAQCPVSAAFCNLGQQVVLEGLESILLVGLHPGVHWQ